MSAIQNPEADPNEDVRLNIRKINKWTKKNDCRKNFILTYWVGSVISFLVDYASAHSLFPVPH